MDSLLHIISLSPQYLLPSWQEVEMTIFTSVLLVALYVLLQSIGQQLENGSDGGVRAGIPVNRESSGAHDAGFGKQDKSRMKMTGTEQTTAIRLQVFWPAELLGN